MLKYAWTVLILFILNSAVAQGQSDQYIKGMVMDENDQPIFAANISIDNSDISTSSYIQSHFQLKLVQGHQHQTQIVTALGDDSYEQPVHVDSDIVLNIKLKTFTEKIDAVQVSAQVEEQRAAVRAKLDKEQIE